MKNGVFSPLDVVFTSIRLIVPSSLIELISYPSPSPCNLLRCKTLLTEVGSKLDTLSCSYSKINSSPKLPKSSFLSLNSPQLILRPLNILDLSFLSFTCFLEIFFLEVPVPSIAVNLAGSYFLSNKKPSL